MANRAYMISLAAGALALLALAAPLLLTGCPKDNAPATQAALPPGVSHSQPSSADGGLASLPPGVDEAKPDEAAPADPNDGVVGGHVSKAVLDSHGLLGGPYPNCTLAVFSALLYDTAVERLDDVKLLQELIDNGSAVFIPNGMKVDFIYETADNVGFVIIMYEGKRWYVKSEDATLVKE